MALSLLFNSCMSQKAILNKNKDFWSIETVDNSGGDVGRYTACRLNTLGVPQVAYARGLEMSIASRSQKNWEIQSTPLGVGAEGRAINMVLGLGGVVHLLYLSPNGLQYVKHSQGSWEVGLITNRAKPDSVWDLAIARDGGAYFIFEDKANKLVLFEEHSGFWKSEEVLKNNRSVQDEPACVAFNPRADSRSFALGENKKGETARLRVARDGNVDDVFEWKDGTRALALESPASAIQNERQGKIAYCQLAWDNSGALHSVFLIQKNSRAKGDLIYGVFRNNRWEQDIIARDFAFKADFSPLALTTDAEGLAHIAYYSTRDGLLEYRHKKKDKSWNVLPAISLDSMNATPNLLVDREGQIWLFFRDESAGALRAAQHLNLNSGGPGPGVQDPPSP